MKNITVPLDVLPQSERDMILDEVIVLRAYYHFLLINYYGPLPFMDKIIPVNSDEWNQLTRPTYNEIANKIVNELQGVIDRKNIPMKRLPFSGDDKVRVPLGFVYGLKSRVLLFNASPLNNPTGEVAKYVAAANAAKEFLDLNAYSLEPFENTKNMFIANITENIEAREVIWRGRDRNTQFMSNQGMDLRNAVPKRSNSQNAKAGETPTQEIVDCYELKNGALIIKNYDASHANPTFTDEALAAGYDDLNDPYSNRDDRFYRDILYNGANFGESYQMGSIVVWTYIGAKGTGSNGNTISGDLRRTFTGYYYGKDRFPLWYGTTNGNQRGANYNVIMRYAEIWLNYAEALCGSGQLSQACDALDMTRLRAHQPSIKEVPGYRLDKEWLMTRIQNERRVELVLEEYSHRFFDVRRWNLITDQNNNTISSMLVEKIDATHFKHTRYQTPFAWVCHSEKYKVLPIPTADKKKLPSMEQPEAWQ